MASRLVALVDGEKIQGKLQGRIEKQPKRFAPLIENSAGCAYERAVGFCLGIEGGGIYLRISRSLAVAVDVDDVVDAARRVDPGGGQQLIASLPLIANVHSALPQRAVDHAPNRLTGSIKPPECVRGVCNLFFRESKLPGETGGIGHARLSLFRRSSALCARDSSEAFVGLNRFCGVAAPLDQRKQVEILVLRRRGKRDRRAPG